MSARLSAALTSVAVALGAPAARAQQPPPRAPRDSARAADSTRAGASTLGAVVVSATRTVRSLRDVPVSASVLPRAEIQSTPAQSTDDVLRTVPGLFIPFENAVVAHPTSNFVSMRGLGGIRTLVLLDGVPLNDPFFGYVQWNKVPAELVDHVEVVRGGASNLFGTYALGGVVSLVTRRPSQDETEGEASYGTNATRRANLFASRALGGRSGRALRLTVDGNYFDTDGYRRPYPQQIGPIDTRGRSDAENVYLKADYTPTDQTSASFRVNRYRLSQDEGSPLGHAGHDALDLSGSVDRKLAGRGTLAARAFYEHGRPWTENTDPITARGVDEFLSNSHVTPTNDLGGSVQYTQPVTRAKSVVTLGADARTITGEDRATLYPVPAAAGTPTRQIGGGTQRTFGVYAQEDWFATSALEVVASARLDAWQNVNAHLTEIPGRDQRFVDQHTTRVNPKLAVRYRLGDVSRAAVTLRAAGYTAFNAPNLDQLYRPYSAQNYANVPNAALGPETLAGGDAGVEVAHAGASGSGAVQLNAFTNTLRDVITYDAIAFDPVYTTRPTNLGRSRARGAELFGDWQWTAGWRLEAGYTYTTSVVTDAGGDTTLLGKTNPDTPKHQLTGALGFTRPGAPSAFLRARYLSERFTDATNARVLSPHFVLDASAAVPVRRGVELFAEAQNVLDRLYVVSTYGFDARGTPRQIFVGARVRTTGGAR